MQDGPGTSGPNAYLYLGGTWTAVTCGSDHDIRTRIRIDDDHDLAVCLAGFELAMGVRRRLEGELTVIEKWM